MEFLTAKQYLRKHCSSQRIKTDIGPLDKFLRGGIRTGKVYEIVGKPGTGGTQLCMKLCLNVQILKDARGLAGKALYLDTRMAFNPDALRNLAEDLAKSLDRRWQMESTPSASDLLRNVHYLECRNAAQLVAGILNCHKYLEDDPNIKLIVVDSISFAIRMLDNVFERTELLMELHDYMRNLQTNHDVAFVLTNDLGYRRHRRRFRLDAVLGQKHAHFIHKRIWFTETECFVGKTQKAKRLICKLSE
ncbi:DNA repair protein RAD51 homolog 3 [Drosophila grimshawi]|uniref:DNA repair protein RAD51 homolog 3 n=1 Tax=Drosophila grimshawi TaxID=7222 RepID=B4JXH5_DROGR|nr:DNA repair protein RAD51 homolog 3 [Drosophila grimshawi]EDV95451.1 GH17957 [Drosophila grimshawi]